MSDNTAPQDAEPKVDLSDVKKDLSWWDRLRAHPVGRWSVDIAIIVLIFTAISAWQTRDLVDTGQPAPDTVLPTMSGDAQDLAAYQGKKTMVVFWAPWCGVCSAESDNISRVKSWLGDRVHVTSVVLDYKGKHDVKAFMDEHGVDYPVLLGTRETAKDYNISAFPTLYILDEDGHIEHTLAGYTTTFGILWRVLI